MTAGVHPAFCADNAVVATSPILELETLATSTYRMRIEAPEIAATVVPGQFVMVRMANSSDPLIGRALAVYDVFEDEEGKPRGIDLVFVSKGKFTSAVVASGEASAVTCWGPLGNGFGTEPVDHLVIAVGGIGQTPMLLLAEEALGKRAFGNPRRSCGYAPRVTMVYGARSGDLLASVDAFSGTGMQLELCTDDGSEGHHARVPDVLDRILLEHQQQCAEQSVRVVTCGPEIMMEKVSDVTQAQGVPCQVSLETPMACGIGICFSCVAKVRQSDGEWDYKRTCVEGPIFDAAKIVW